MPFTPLHMGPGIAVKAVLQRKFSLVVFGWSQIVIDIQPLVAIITGKIELHGASHTYLGATFIGLLSALSGKYLGELGLNITRKQHDLPINWTVSFISAYIGTYSHVFIDSIMHSDIKPFMPFNMSNPMYEFLSIENLHVLCIISALIGGIIYFIVERKIKKTI